jgi:hypothetical protein
MRRWADGKSEREQERAREERERARAIPQMVGSGCKQWQHAMTTERLDGIQASFTSNTHTQRQLNQATSKQPEQVAGMVMVVMLEEEATINNNSNEQLQEAGTSTTTRAEEDNGATPN